MGLLCDRACGAVLSMLRSDQLQSRLQGVTLRKGHPAPHADVLRQDIPTHCVEPFCTCLNDVQKKYTSTLCNISEPAVDALEAGGSPRKHSLKLMLACAA